MDAVTAKQLKTSFEDFDEEIWMPDLGKVNWKDLDYFGWVHPSGHLGYIALLSPNSGKLCGSVLRRIERPIGRRRADMCAWCHHVHRADGLAMFTLAVKGSKGRHRLGNVACKDLDCSLRIRKLVKPENLMQESLYLEAKIWRMQMSLHRWLGRAGRI